MSILLFIILLTYFKSLLQHRRLPHNCTKSQRSAIGQENRNFFINCPQGQVNAPWAK